MTKKMLYDKIERLETTVDDLCTRLNSSERQTKIPVLTDEYEFLRYVGETRKIEDVEVKDVVAQLVAHLGLSIEIKGATPSRMTLVATPKTKKGEGK